MREASYEFGLVSSLTAEALGEPGQRTFRLLVHAPEGAAVLWMEKEQLLELGLYIKQAQGNMEKEDDTEKSTDEGETAALSVEFKVGRMAVEYIQERDIFRFWNHDIESEEKDIPKLVFDVGRSQAARLSDEALTVCAAGRPICPLCHQPINKEGHMCVRSNGHAALDQTSLE